MHEAGYFHVASQKLQLKVNFFHLQTKGIDVDRIARILDVMEEIKGIEPDIILLYTNNENIDFMLQQVREIIKHILCLRRQLKTALVVFF